MLEYIKGKLTEATPSKAIIEIQGIGHGLLIPLSTYSKLPQTGKEVCMYVSTVIREDSHKDYGFLTREERDLFEKLNDVSGIGPKTALALIGHMDLATLHCAISKGDVNAICKVPGIGKKTAERMIIDLRDKLKHLNTQNFPSLLSNPSIAASDAISALVNLGYPAVIAQKAIKKALDQSETEEPSLSDLITSALRNL
ncbi:MAG TPA: Holliday junction branch migration protein RuvA [Rhabdochlamydiaceae bacterium]|nr:Holliday junction branch migration protein RuvA [Rhabdochlamydiaceae bacterium]